MVIFEGHLITDKRTTLCETERRKKQKTFRSARLSFLFYFDEDVSKVMAWDTKDDYDLI